MGGPAPKAPSPQPAGSEEDSEDEKPKKKGEHIKNLIYDDCTKFCVVTLYKSFVSLFKLNSIAIENKVNLGCF